MHGNILGEGACRGHPSYDRIPWELLKAEKPRRKIDAGRVCQDHEAMTDITVPDTLLTPHQGQFLAHWLTLEGSAEATLSRAIASARVDLNPHQVDAALFALHSPLSQGVILADEVGLGKTIEAGLVIAQRWAQRRRRVILVVPATLRKQWVQELWEKFSLPAMILEARSFNQARKDGCANPFGRDDAIIICSYEFAARKRAEIHAISWHLVVFDEAHKLRNVYKGNKTATILRDALLGAPKIMLTATPLQNSLMELYGLVSVIDPYFFGSETAFRSRYAQARVAEEALTDLRQRLRPMVRRSLRRQVQEEGGIRFTNRYSLTEDFRPTTEEEALYRQVSAYLQRDDILAIKPKARHLVTLVLRKILASSSFAITRTLETMLQRLEKQQALNDGVFADYETADELRDEMDDDDGELDGGEAPALDAEIQELKGYQALAASIQRNAKGDALLRVLERAFEMIQRLGGARKAVIFTESCRTQGYLLRLLEENGYADEIILLNGSNSDPGSKAAIVEAFRDEKTILIATESGGEGINLQFCSLLINYDLPWNPQRVEQRIGRVHRYGQKHDVVVVNFLNKGNRADERVFQLLDQKFKLFQGVFGASDEILGAIASGVDIEKRIHEIYQRCRTEVEIDEQFDALQRELDEELAVREASTRQTLLEHFDAEVVRRLRDRRGSILPDLDRYQQTLLDLARAELPGAEFHDDHFFHQGHRYDLRWREADTQDSEFFRPTQGLGAMLIQRAIERGLAPATLVLSYSGLSLRYADLEPWIGQSGWLEVAKLAIDSVQPEEHLLLSALNDAGQALEPESCDRLLRIPARLIGAPPLPDSALLEGLRSTQIEKKRVLAEQRNEQFFEEETEKLERWAEDCRVALDQEIKRLDQEIRDAKRALRQLSTLVEKTRAKREIKNLERERDEQMLNYYEEKKRISEEEERLLDQIEAKLDIRHHVDTLFVVRWQLEP